jgi:hypothetical protein
MSLGVGFIGLWILKWSITHSIQNYSVSASIEFHSEVLGIKTLTYESREDTIQPLIESVPEVSTWNLEWKSLITPSAVWCFGIYKPWFHCFTDSPKKAGLSQMSKGVWLLSWLPLELICYWVLSFSFVFSLLRRESIPVLDLL